MSKHSILFQIKEFIVEETTINDVYDLFSDCIILEIIPLTRTSFHVKVKCKYNFESAYKLFSNGGI